MADEVLWKNVHSNNTKADFCGFLKALDVWIEKPHVINRRLMGALIVKKAPFEHLTEKDLACFFADQRQQLLHTQLLQGSFISDTSKKSEIGEKICLSKGETDIIEIPEKDSFTDPADDEEGNSITLRKLLPRQLDKRDPICELVFIEKSERRVYFFPLSPKALEKDKYQDWLNESESYCLFYEPLAEENLARVSLLLRDDKTTVNDGRRDGVLCPTIQWLQDHLLPKLCKWAEEIQPDGKSSKGSLRLVPLDQYTLLYHRLKQDYGEKLVKIWPERTDPQKFVYEDIAIASYLLVLWEEERRKLNLELKQSFVDLGCGNGLLVHILSEEGHPGTGIDVRRRKIWNLYGGKTNLQERALDPTGAGLFPDVDWLIGNHSDELTPWIPVMAARSSYATRYFVLPCCLFDFNCKFVRRSNKVPQYRGYLDFVHEVGETCGFQVEEDSLRIPSTKRICQIGRIRTYPKENQVLRDKVIKDMILQRGCDVDACVIPDTLAPRTSTGEKDLIEPPRKSSRRTTGPLSHENPEDTNCLEIAGREQKQSVSTCAVSCNNIRQSESFGHQSNSPIVSSSTFQPRPAKEPMRNCTSLDQSLKDFIVNTVARELLGVSLKTDELSPDTTSAVNTSQPSRSSSTTWRRGVEMGLSEVAKLFDKSTLLQLKNECGGLQTLLRNHYYIFKVVGGVVQMRDWTQETSVPRGRKGDLARKQRRSQALWKTSVCWFNLHHPDGCPVSVEKCPFAHSEDELKERPTAEYLSSL